MGGFLQPDESLDGAADRILYKLTGLKDVYMEQMHAFSAPQRDPVERTIAVAYVALIDIQKYEQQLSEDYHAHWFQIDELPQLIFDHNEMVALAMERLRYKAALHPILFELLPTQFTLPHLQTLYEGLYDTQFDKRNFTRKILSTGLLVKKNHKDKTNSKKGAFYYKLDKKKYKEGFETFFNFIPRADIK